MPKLSSILFILLVGLGVWFYNFQTRLEPMEYPAEPSLKEQMPGGLEEGPDPPAKEPEIRII